MYTIDQLHYDISVGHKVATWLWHIRPHLRVYMYEINKVGTHLKVQNKRAYVTVAGCILVDGKQDTILKSFRLS